MNKSVVAQVTQCVETLRTYGAEPRYLYCTQKFHDAMLDELKSMQRFEAYDGGPMERVDSFNGLQVRIVPGEGGGALVTVDELPL